MRLRDFLNEIFRPPIVLKDKNVYASNVAQFSQLKYHIYIYKSTILDDVPGGLSLLNWTEMASSI